jgi:phosphotransferase system enzyme I (PtsP)
MGHSTKMSVVAAAHESSLLLTLEEISQLVSHSRNPHETLENIVRLIQGRFGTDVSSVYLVEPERGELVLAATVGLDPSGVGRVRMKLNEGLTGLVAERMAAIMEPDARTHSRFKYFPEAGEDSYHSFLGVPLIESGVVQGVLVVQTVERRAFFPNEIRMLVAAGAQLAPVVSGARLLERVAAADSQVAEAFVPRLPRPRARSLAGSPLSSGTGLGQAYLIDQNGILGDLTEEHEADVAVETQRLATAMEAAREEITRLSRRISFLVGEDHGAILQAQLMILQDSTVERDLANCLALGSTAEAALARTLDTYVARFQKLANPFFRERVFDIRDVFRRIFWHLRPRQLATASGEQALVLVAHEASVLDLFSVDLDHLVGVVVEHGGPQSHAVIIARSLGIPMVGQISGLLDQIRAGQLVRIDGTLGYVELDPSTAIDQESATPAEQVPSPGSARNGSMAAIVNDRPGMPRIEANVNLLNEAARVIDCGARGVGLYRSEMLFLARRTLPTEEEQVEIYRKLIEALDGRPTTIRTFDLRPDKLAHGSCAPMSSAQALDWRLVHESPILQRLFKDQVRAILRAAAAGPVRLLIPLVTRNRLLDFAIATVEQARNELILEGLEHGEGVPLGVTIEVAAVVPLVAEWSQRVDFFALGTNDLIASALGIDRADPVGALDDDLLHPGLIRMIGEVISSAHTAGRPVSVCGEMASDLDGALVLAALGADSLSLAVDRVGPVCQLLARIDAGSLPELGSRLIEASTVEQIKTLLADEIISSPELAGTGATGLR